MELKPMEIQYLSVLGLVLIAAGWGMQYLSLRKGKKEVVKMLPALNIIGAVILIIGAYQGGAMDIVAGNALTIAGALLVFLAIKEK